MLSAQDVADFFLSPVDEEDGEQITNLKLQKLLYYAQGYALALLNRPLFHEKIYRWAHGPVVVDVYHRYKRYGRSPLPPSLIEPIKYQEEEWLVLNRVRTEYGQYTAWRLRDMTHTESPYLQAAPDAEMDLPSIKAYFDAKLHTDTLNFDLQRMQARVEGEFVIVPEFSNVEALRHWLES